MPLHATRQPVGKNPIITSSIIDAIINIVITFAIAPAIATLRLALLSLLLSVSVVRHASCTDKTKGDQKASRDHGKPREITRMSRRGKR